MIWWMKYLNGFSNDASWCTAALSAQKLFLKLSFLYWTIFYFDSCDNLTCRDIRGWRKYLWCFMKNWRWFIQTLSTLQILIFQHYKLDWLLFSGDWLCIFSVSLQHLKQRIKDFALSYTKDWRENWIRFSQTKPLIGRWWNLCCNVFPIKII